MSAGAFDSRLGRLQVQAGCFGLGKQASATAASGTFPRWTLHCGAASALCELDLSMALAKRYTSLVSGHLCARCLLSASISNNNILYKRLEAINILATISSLPTLQTFDTATTIQTIRGFLPTFDG
jgi:hypothetical protein